MMDLRRVNLNHLISLDILLAECSVTRAAERCFITQTAMSAILKQLRELFDDPLLVKQGNKLNPTAKALYLHPRVKQAIQNIQLIFKDDDFNPATSEKNFNLMVSTHGEYTIVPKLLSFLSIHGPGLTVKVIPFNENENFETTLLNDVDLLIAGIDKLDAKDILCEPLFKENLVVFMRKENPLVDKELTKADYISSKHIAVRYETKKHQIYLEEKLNRLGLIRDIQYTLPSLISAIELVANTDCLATLPEFLTNSLKGSHKIIAKKLPVSIDNDYVNLFYHQTRQQAKSFQWLVNVIHQGIEQARNESNK